jgi:hypothetical protein
MLGKRSSIADRRALEIGARGQRPRVSSLEVGDGGFERQTDEANMADDQPAGVRFVRDTSDNGRRGVQRVFVVPAGTCMCMINVSALSAKSTNFVLGHCRQQHQSPATR